jgi:hypothetical protein
MTRPLEGGTYLHHKGGLYDVITIALDKTTLEQRVIYKSQQDGQVWDRPITEFQEPRYKLLNRPLK